VTQQSAGLYGKRMIPLNVNHSGLNKYSGETDESYLLVLPEIRRMVDGGNQVVNQRYAIQGMYNGDHKNRKRENANFLL
jgi:hypothetical protein